MITCIRCQRPVVAALLAAHFRRHDGADWFSQRRAAPVRTPGAGSRSRATAEGRGRASRRWVRP